MKQLDHAEFSHVLQQVHVNLPLFMFNEYFELFMANGIRPEIGLDCETLDNVSLSQMRDYAKAFNYAGLSTSVHAPFMGLEPYADAAEKRALTRNYLEKALKAVEIFKPSHVVWHTCLRRNAPYHDPAFIDNAVQKLLPVTRWFAQNLYNLNARLMLENVYEPDPGLHLQLLSELKPYNAGFCLDTGHSNAFVHKPLSLWLNSDLKNYLGEIHLHDNDGTHDAHRGAGSGNVNFEPLLAHLRVLPQPQWPLLTLEPHEPKDLLLSLNFVKDNILQK